MLSRGALLASAVVGLAACGTAPPTRPAPTDAAVRAPIAVVQQQPFLVWGNLVDLVQQSEEFEITQLDEQSGYIVARYSGDPEPYVSCGPATGNLESVPAAAPAGSDAAADARNGVLRLDGRLMVQVEPDGSDTLVTTQSTYVLTRFPDGGQTDGARHGHETVSFGTGGQGEFAGGLVCQPTGEFERVVLSGLPDPRAAGRQERGPAVTSEATESLSSRVTAVVATTRCSQVQPQLAGNTVRLSGYVENEADVERLRAEVEQIAGINSVETALEVHPWPFCEILQITAPFRQTNAPDGHLEVALAGGDEVLREGEPLTLELGVPADANHLYLAYIQQDGRVGHIGTPPAREWASTGTGRIRYDTGFEVAEPFGREMILAIISESPLFDQVRPAFEAPDQFVQALRQELANLVAADPNQMILASHLFITTQGNDAL